MKKKRLTEEQIIGALKEYEPGAKVHAICRRVSEQPKGIEPILLSEKNNIWKRVERCIQSGN